MTVDAKGMKIARDWFVTPHPDLNDLAPADAIGSNRFAEVIHAAQALLDAQALLAVQLQTQM